MKIWRTLEIKYIINRKKNKKELRNCIKRFYSYYYYYDFFNNNYFFYIYFYSMIYEMKNSK